MREELWTAFDKWLRDLKTRPTVFGLKDSPKSMKCVKVEELVARYLLDAQDEEFRQELLASLRQEEPSGEVYVSEPKWLALVSH
jgi:hypothetical protein